MHQPVGVLWSQCCGLILLAAISASACHNQRLLLQQEPHPAEAAAVEQNSMAANRAEPAEVDAVSVPYTEAADDPVSKQLRSTVQPQPLPDVPPAIDYASRVVTESAGQALGDSGNRCATHTTEEDKQGRQAAERKVARLVRAGAGSRLGTNAAATPIEVFFHNIVWRQQGIISRLQVNKQLDALNAAYQKLNVRFVLRQAFSYDLGFQANGQRFFSATYMSHEEYALKKAWRKGGAGTLNIYTVNMSYGLLGWSTFPWRYDNSRCANCKAMDGVVLNIDSMPIGKLTNFNKGNTAVHEVSCKVGAVRKLEGVCAATPEVIDQARKVAGQERAVLSQGCVEASTP